MITINYILNHLFIPWFLPLPTQPANRICIIEADTGKFYSWQFQVFDKAARFPAKVRNAHPQFRRNRSFPTGSMMQCNLRVLKYEHHHFFTHQQLSGFGGTTPANRKSI
jgi:hypothetical protein